MIDESDSDGPCKDIEAGNNGAVHGESCMMIMPIITPIDTLNIMSEDHSWKTMDTDLRSLTCFTMYIRQSLVRWIPDGSTEMSLAVIMATRLRNLQDGMNILFED
jgi:hypothetical protein